MLPIKTNADIEVKRTEGGEVQLLFRLMVGGRPRKTEAGTEIVYSVTLHPLDPDAIANYMRDFASFIASLIADEMRKEIDAIRHAVQEK